MAPPAAGPLIQGSTTPMAKETATAASTASPPASSTVAPTSAARRWAAATTPPRVGMTALRMICVREKLSMGGVADLKCPIRVARDRLGTSNRKAALGAFQPVPARRRAVFHTGGDSALRLLQFAHADAMKVALSLPFAGSHRILAARS